MSHKNIGSSPHYDILRNKDRKYKYELLRTYQIAINPNRLTKLATFIPITTGWIDISESGILTIQAGYQWDGASGLAIDTPSAIRASLVHDALYQLLRMGYEINRKYADQLLRDICIEDTMDQLRANMWYQIVRIFGEKHARPRKRE